MKVVGLLIFALFLFEAPVWSVPQDQHQITKQKERRSRAVARRRAANPWIKGLNAIEQRVGNPLYFGLALMACGVAFYFLRSARLQQAKEPAAVSLQSSRAIWIIVIAGAILRIYGLGEKSLDHTEIYVPGIPLPQGISEPPPRIDLAETVSWHFHDEPHPPGYYFLMWPWTKIFGTSELALRLPSALFGIASIWLIFQLVSLTHSRRAALLAAAMLALNGHHIFWSQMARMYAMTCFLGLLSTLLLFRIDRARNQVAYVAVTFLGIFTEVHFWPFLAMQALWAAIVMRPAKAVLRLQAIVIILGAPLWAHAVYRARPSPLAEPSLTFLQHYFAFGFLIHPDSFALDPRNPPLILLLALMLAALLLAVLAYRKGLVAESKTVDPGFLMTIPIAIGSIFTTVGYALLAHSRQPRMAKTMFVAIAALFLPWLLSKAGRLKEVLQSPDLLYYLLAFIPPIGIFLLSYRFSLLGTRLFLLFVPFLLILIAIGCTRLPAKVFSMVATVLLAAHLYSIVHFHNTLSTPIDYKGLAKEINERYARGDVIFAHHKHWAITPLFYYLRERKVVTDNFESHQNVNKIFIVHVKGVPPAPAMLEAVKDRRLKETVKQRRAYADIYTK